MIIREKAHAKLNLNLEVPGKRYDGYHDIYSIMVRTEFCDTLSLTHCDLSPGGELSIEIVAKPSEFCDFLKGVPREKNLIYLAASHYLRALGYGGEFLFEVEKNIPAGGGLGGGSSNAAIAIEILARYLERGIDPQAMAAAEATGSDVPFFLMKSAALAESRGEILTPIDFSLPHDILLVNPGMPVDTGRAYASLALSPGESMEPMRSLRDDLLSILNEPEKWKGIFKNDFQRPIFQQFPVIGEIMEEIYAGGALFSLMTGSGSSLFGVFPHVSAVAELRDHFREQGYWSVLTKLL